MNIRAWPKIRAIESWFGYKSDRLQTNIPSTNTTIYPPNWGCLSPDLLKEGFVIVDLACDICGHVMLMLKPESGGGEFRCEDPNCGQRWYFSVNHEGEIGCSILGRMYPSGMDQTSSLYSEFLDYQLKNLAFKLRAQMLCGLMNSSDADATLQKAREQIATKRAEIAKSTK